MMGRPLFALIFSALTLTRAVCGEELSIGFLKQVDQSGIFGSSIRSVVTRNAVFLTLLTAKENGGVSSKTTYGLVGALDLSVNPRGVRLSLKPGLTFEDTAPVRISDILFSLNRCSLEVSSHLQVMANGTMQISPETAQTDNSVADNPSARSGLSSNDAILELLSSCPILPASSKRFGSTLGILNSYVSSGFYAPVDQPNSSSLQLARSTRYLTSRQDAPQKITLQDFSDPEKLLSSLRSGSLDAIFTIDAVVIHRANQDQTLRVSECQGTMLIFRRGLNATCEPKVELEKWHYTRDSEDGSENSPVIKSRNGRGAEDAP